MKTRTGRRTFLKTVAIAGGLESTMPAPPGGHDAAAGARDQFAATRQAQILYPRTFTGRQLALIAFPLGGVAAGSISLGGRGQLRDWEIFNRPDKGKSPEYAFASIWVRNGNRRPVARVLEARLMPPYEGSQWLGEANAPGLPRLASCSFKGEYPLATITFRDTELPVDVTLEAFTPFIPLDADESGLPVAILRYRVANPSASETRVSIAWSIDNPVGKEGRMCEFRHGAGFAGLFMRNPFLSASDPLAGSFALSVLEPEGGEVSYLRGWQSGSQWRVGPLLFWDDFSADGALGPEAALRDAVGSLCFGRKIAPNGHADFTFLLSWHFPNRTPERCGWLAPKGEERSCIGNFYTRRFADAWVAAEYTAQHLEKLERRTRQFVRAMRETTLPAAVRDAATANLSTLATQTCFRTADGHFHGFEGCKDQRGCCYGSCTHVWNYETATAFLFPSLSRSLREQQFGYSTDAEGRMDFRQILPEGKEHSGLVAADGQMGAIMKLYLDWRLSGDTRWLRGLWPAAKRAIEFAWVRGGWDEDRDGVMEGAQHNTYDVEFFGPNPLCGIWYLGALRAAEEMARAVGETGAAEEYHRLFRNGSKWIDENLFNREYYIQKVQGRPKDKIAKGLISGMGAVDTENPDFQVAEGCLVDQLCGQYLADIVGLGHLLDSANIQKALRSIYRYNNKKSLHRHESVQRAFALNDEAALVICDYGRNQRPRIPFPYFAEVMTGFEYSAAVLMLGHGMVQEGLEVIENIRRRYDGERRNPWNEAECGYHYARAMAAWSAVVALSGFQYDGSTGALAVRPRFPREEFSSFWSTASAWGSFALNHKGSGTHLLISIAEGDLPLRSVILPWRGSATSHVRLQELSLPHRVEIRDNEALVTLAGEARLRAGEKLSILV